MLRQGIVFSKLRAGEETSHVPIKGQADLDLYTIEEQYRR